MGIGTYSQAEYYVDSLVDVRRLLRDFAAMSLNYTKEQQQLSEQNNIAQTKSTDTGIIPKSSITTHPTVVTSNLKGELNDTTNDSLDKLGKETSSVSLATMSSVSSLEFAGSPNNASKGF